MCKILSRNTLHLRKHTELLFSYYTNVCNIIREKYIKGQRVEIIKSFYKNNGSTRKKF